MSAIIKSLTVCSLSFLGIYVVKCNFDLNSGDEDRGFGRLYKWIKFENAFSEARKQDKPIFLVIHRSTCPACIMLKERFSKSIRILDLSEEFVMVNVENGVETLDNQDKYQPDGKYVPRILFFTPSGELIWEAFNQSPCGDPEYRYFYKSPPSIVQTMRFVIQNRDKFLYSPSKN